jgi:hypothetical protein
VKSLIEEMSAEGTVPPVTAVTTSTKNAHGNGNGIDQNSKGMKEAMAEKQWDYERVKSCVEFLQMGVEKLLLLLPEGGVIREMISIAAAMVASYRRRYQFIVAKVQSRTRVEW